MTEPTLNDLDLDQTFLHVHEEPYSGLTMWWIDDCFTNEQAADSGGGHLPLDKIRNDEISDYSANSNEQACVDLLRVAEQEGVNMKVCSFEYADKHWDDIDVSKSAILIDIGYEGQPDKDFDDNFYGIEFYYAKAESGKPYALCSFLSDVPTRVVDWAENQKGWFPSIPYPMTKESLDLHEQIKTMVQYLKDSQPRGASEWNAETWHQLRDEAWETCESFGGFVKAHHFPGGGDSLPKKKTDKKKQANLQEELYKRLSEVGGRAARQLPEHNWREGNREIPAWDQPPIRAIAQFDKGGHDLSFVLGLVEQEIKNRLDNIDLGVTFQPPTLGHDYLWFNASALSRGLYRLAEGFSGDFDRPDRNLNAESGRVNWHIREEGDGLYITVSQVKLKEGKEDRDAQTSRRPRDLPNENAASGIVREAYGFFLNAGAEIEEQDGSLIIQILSQPHPEHPSVRKLQKKA